MGPEGRNLCQAVTFGSSDAATLVVSGTGALTPQQNSPNLSPLTVSAELCDGQVVGPTSVYVNLRYSSPFDYDIGNVRGAAGGNMQWLRGGVPECN